jgi:hypothetical protein
MQTPARPRRLFVLGIVPVFAGIAIWFWWPKGEPERPPAADVTGKGSNALREETKAVSVPSGPSVAAGIVAKGEKKVDQFSEIRRQLQSGELTTLPPEHAPPPVPVIKEEP